MSVCRMIRRAKNMTGEYWRLMRGGGELANKFSFDKLISSYKQSPNWNRLGRCFDSFSPSIGFSRFIFSMRFS